MIHTIFSCVVVYIEREFAGIYVQGIQITQL